MASHKDPRFLHNLSYHPRWQHDAIKVRRKRRTRTVATDGCSKCSEFDSLAVPPSPSSGWLSSKPQVSSSSRSWCGPWFLLPLLVLSLLPYQAWATTFTIALVGPWTCDLLYSKSLPDLAARLATSRINKDPYLNKGYWYDYTLVNEDCKASRALPRFAELEGYGSAFLGPANPGYCASAAMYTKEWDVGLLSWGCLKPQMRTDGMHPTYVQPLPLTSRVLFTVLRYFRWAHVSIISEETDLWEATGNELASSLRALGLPVNPVVTMGDDKDGPRRALTKVREADRVRGEYCAKQQLFLTNNLNKSEIIELLVSSTVIIMCMPSVLIGGHSQYQLLTTALSMRMIDRGYVFIPYDTLLYSLPYRNANYYVLGNDTKLRKAYDGVLTITMDSGERNFYEAFKDAQDSYEIRSSTAPEQVRLPIVSKHDKSERGEKQISSLSSLSGLSILWHHLQHDVLHSYGGRAGPLKGRPLGNWSYPG